ncbi:winged helix-turn-helix domain-containing protein [Streptomyces sp. NBC_01788]|uniref:AfsR/SARP family transcriptional regulator n=1 Tax=Streptomyces sp. NBC_01788 TaxID=2975940 RepID=UPI002DDC780A|nr:BTAD domain-containing putative transcriptional regulator [Streptomyces sp. NBC_01788]WSB26475.1 winged helix-turn-helix domain-containing protein [Streptomyces sp. NBC_01788]
MDLVRYRILGTTQALRPDGTVVPLGGARLRALLTVLALRPGRTVPVRVLVDEVWDGEPPADATGALQALVGRLRRTLGAGAVASAEGGYRLAAATDDVDLHRFERLAGEGLRALGEGDPAKAAAVLDDALALWRGPALADLPDRTAEAARWDTRHLDVRRARLTAALALGHAERSLPELTALCDTHPLDEPLQTLRLRALRDAGRTAEALAAYEDVRRLLADRLGSDPGPELRALHAELLRPTGGTRPGPGPVAGAGARTPAPGSGTAPGPVAGGGGWAAEPASGAASGPGLARTAEPGPGAVSGSGAASGPVAGGGGWAPEPGSGAVSGPGLARIAEPGPGAVSGSGAASGPVAGGGGWAPELGSGAVAGRRAAGEAAVPAAVPLAGPAAGVPDAAAGEEVGPGMADARPPSNLRARITSFVGREADIGTIRADLDAARLVTLLGPGGAGKTRLSQEAAEAVRPVPLDGVWLAELAPVDDAEAVPGAVLTAVGARETVLYGAGAEEMRAAVADRHNDPVERLVEHCARRRMLLLLDNCEHVVDAAARLVEELLARCPHLTVLATSREPLGIPGEVLRPVEPLPDPVALRLFAERGAAVRPGFRTDADQETADACAEICRRLDGLPLAIELAAARLRMLTPRQIADRLDDRFRLLTSGSRTVLPRQQTLRAVVDWSWDLLDADERDVLSRLSVFAGGCDLAAAEAVCGPAAFDALASLVDKSLVVAAPAADGGMRYRLLETVAEYARERLDETGGRTATERAHLTYYRELARTTEPLMRGSSQREAMVRIELEYENLRTALRHAVAARDEQEGLCLILSLANYWQMRDMRLEARNWCAEFIEFGPDPFTEPVRPAEPVWQRCTDAPPPMTGEVLAEARRGLHLVHLSCMETELEAWESPEAKRKLRLITQVYQPGQPQICRSPGMLWMFAVMLTGEVKRLLEVTDAAVRTCRETPGFEWELAHALQWRANLLANRTDWAGDAGRDADESLEIFRRLDDAWGTAEALSARAEAHERTGAYLSAAADYRSAIDHAERLGAAAQVTVLTARLGSALMESGDTEQGERLLWEVVEQSRNSHNEAMPPARLYLAGRLGMTGRTPEAREQLRLLREEFGISHFVVFDAFILGAESWVDAVDGLYEDALDKVRRALQRAQDPLSEAIAPHMPSAYLTIAARALAGVDGGRRARDAARCLGAADALLPPRHVASAMERHVRDEVVALTRELLGDEAYGAAYAEGGGLSPQEAAALI